MNLADRDVLLYKRYVLIHRARQHVAQSLIEIAKELHMNQYEIMKKENELVAVELGTFGTPDELERYEKLGFIEQNKNISAKNNQEAILKYTNSDYIDNVENIPQNKSQIYNKISDSNRYNTARYVYKFIEFVGWVCVGSGILFFIVLASQVPTYASSFGLVLATSLPGLSLAMGGVVTVALSQILRGTIDTAENSFKILEKLTK